MFKKFSQWFDNPPPQTAPKDHLCDFQGCTAVGLYRAPKSRDHLENATNEWYWLCLEHIRIYNQSWNYYSQMSEAQINYERQKDITWDRPTWSFTTKTDPFSFQDMFKDPFGFFTTSALPSPAPLTPEQQALALLELTRPFSLQELRTNYRRLVKKYHPDTNQNNPHAEEMMRKINQAYTCLKKADFS